MNEPAKKPGQVPESYQPQKPEMMRALEEAQGNAVAGQEHSAVPLPEIITKKFMLAGFEAAIDLSESHWQGMDDVIASLKANIANIGNLVQPVRFVGAWEADPRANYKKKKNHSKCLYFYGLEVTSLDGVPAGCVTKEFPESAFAVFRQRDHGEPAYEWLAAAGYEQDKAFEEKYALDIEIFENNDNGPPWDFLIPIQAPESYQPKLPEMMQALEGAQSTSEKLVDTFTDGKIAFEVFDRPETLWVGSLAWAADNDSEPDGDALLARFRSLLDIPKQARINPDWSAGISINYRHGRQAPKGMLYAQETWTAAQDSHHDLFIQPAGLYLRMRKNDKEAKKLLRKKHYEMEDLYAYMAQAASRHGYRLADGNPIGIYYHDHQTGTWEYAIIPVEKV
jgi:hypothetical protein